MDFRAAKATLNKSSVDTLPSRTFQNIAVGHLGWRQEDSCYPDESKVCHTYNEARR